MDQKYNIHTTSVQMTVSPTTVTTVPDPDSYDKGYGAGYTEGHEAGKSKGYTEGHEAGKSEGYTEGHTVGYSEGYGEAYGLGMEMGKYEEYNRFWDSFQRPEVSDTMAMFAGQGWNVDTFKPKKDIKVNDAYMMFYNSRISGDLTQILEDLRIKFDTSGMTSAQYMFWLSRFTRLPVIDMRKLTTSAHTLQTFNQNYLTTIDGVLVAETTLFSSNTFQGTKIANVTFEGVIGSTINFKSCPLTAKSIVSVVEHLSDTATGKTAIFNQDATNNADWSTTNYASWDELKATKPNWGFAYNK